MLEIDVSTGHLRDIDSSNFVTYTGATADLDLGSYWLTAGGASVGYLQCNGGFSTSDFYVAGRLSTNGVVYVMERTSVDYSLDYTHETLICENIEPITVTLNPYSDGQRHTIKAVGADVEIFPGGGTTIDGETTLTLSMGDCLTILYNSYLSQWCIA